MRLIIKKELFTITDYMNTSSCALAVTVKEAFPGKVISAGVFTVNIDEVSYDVEYITKAPYGVLSMYDIPEEERTDLEINLLID